MKITALIVSSVLAVLAIGGVILFRQESIVFETYLIPSGFKEGWITVEYDNPTCPPMTNRIRREFFISESGYFCTSARRHDSWFHHTYYIVDKSGKRVPLIYEQHIFHRYSIYLDPISEDPNCKRVVADVFWYGKQENMDNQDVVALQKRHPNCTGITVPFKSPEPAPSR